MASEPLEEVRSGVLTYAGTMILLVSALLAWLAAPSAFSATALPYPTRTKDYSGWSPGIQSDTNTTGMAGATVALPSSISSAESNPAGFAMETGSLSAQINRISVIDKRVQPDGQPIESNQWGLGVSPPPWGFSLSYYSPMTEAGTYVSPNTGREIKTEASLKEFRLTAARSFFEDHLAIGVSAELVKAVREIGSVSYDSYTPSYRIGALYRIRNHIVLGASYSPPLSIGPASDNVPQADMPGFNRAMLRPSEINLGIGWVPNRFFKTGFSLSRIGTTDNTALLADQSTATGTTPTLIPRAGASYILAQYTNFQSELAVGTYFATSRLHGKPSRWHATMGWEANPGFINLGVGFDLSQDYRNIMIGIGIDLVRTLRTFKIIPRDPTPPLNGVFPRPTTISADGLPDALTRGEEKSTSPPTLKDVKQIIKEVPKNIADKVKGKPTSVEKAPPPKKKNPTD